MEHNGKNSGEATQAANLVYGRSPTPPVIEFHSSITGELVIREFADVGRRKWTERAWQCCKCTSTFDDEYARSLFHVHCIIAKENETPGMLPSERHRFVSSDNDFIFVGRSINRPTIKRVVSACRTSLHGEKKSNHDPDEPNNVPDICDGQHDVDDEYEMPYADPKRKIEHRGHEKCSKCLEYSIVTYLKRIGDTRVPVRVRMNAVDAILFQQQDSGWRDCNGDLRWAVNDEATSSS